MQPVSPPSSKPRGINSTLLEVAVSSCICDYFRLSNCLRGVVFMDEAAPYGPWTAVHVLVRAPTGKITAPIVQFQGHISYCGEVSFSSVRLMGELVIITSRMEYIMHLPTACAKSNPTLQPMLLAAALILPMSNSWPV